MFFKYLLQCYQYDWNATYEVYYTNIYKLENMFTCNITTLSEVYLGKCMYSEHLKSVF